MSRTTRRLQRITTGLNSEFSFSLTAKETCLPNYLPIDGESTWILHFPNDIRAKGNANGYVQDLNSGR